ncbi:hypothetical protein HC583_24645, partial [Escherichia coli]|nr:hypothetical protein [Escherichia coli]
SEVSISPLFRWPNSVNHFKPSTGLEKKGNSKGSMLLIWRPFISPRRMFTTVSKAALMAIGQGVRRAA